MRQLVGLFLQRGVLDVVHLQRAAALHGGQLPAHRHGLHAGIVGLAQTGEQHIDGGRAARDVRLQVNLEIARVHRDGLGHRDAVLGVPEHGGLLVGREVRVQLRHAGLGRLRRIEAAALERQRLALAHHVDQAALRLKPAEIDAAVGLALDVRGAGVALDEPADHLAARVEHHVLQVAGGDVLVARLAVIVGGDPVGGDGLAEHRQRPGLPAAGEQQRARGGDQRK